MKRYISILIVIIMFTSYIDVIGGSNIPIATIKIFSESGGVKTVYAVNGEVSIDILAGVKHSILVSSYGYRSYNLSLPGLNQGEIRNIDVQLGPAPIIEGYVKSFDDVGIQGARISFDGIETISSWNGYYAVYVDKDIGDNVEYIAGPPIDPEVFMDTPFTIDTGSRFYAKLFPYEQKYQLGYTYGNLNIDRERVYMDIVLPESTVLGGQIFFRNGSPVMKGEVLLVSINNPLTLSTNISNGIFSFRGGVSEGNYDIYLRLEGQTGYTDILLEQGLTISCTPTCPPSVTRGYIIPELVTGKLKVVNVDGQPLQGLYIDLESDNGDLRISSVSDRNGEVKIPLFDSTIYNFEIYLSRYRVLNGSIYVPPGTNPYTKTFTLSLKLFHISGRISNLGSEEEPINLYAVGHSDYPNIDIEIPIGYRSDGSFTAYLPQYLNISGFNVSLNYSIYLSSEYLYRGVRAVVLGHIDSDIANVEVTIPTPMKATLNIAITFNGEPPRPTNGIRYRVGLWNRDTLYIIEIANYDPVGLCPGYCGAITFIDGWINKSGDIGSLDVMLRMVSGLQDSIYLTVPKDVAGGEFMGELIDGLSINNMDRRLNGISITIVRESSEGITLKIEYNVSQVDLNRVSIKPTEIIDEFRPHSVYLIPVTLAIIYLLIKRYIH